MLAGLELDPTNVLLSEGKQHVEAAMKETPKNPFGSSDFFQRLLSDPRTAPLMAQPDFMAMFKDVQSNPQNMMKHLNDPRMQLVRAPLENCHGTGVKRRRSWKWDWD